MKYRVELKPRAEKDLRDLPRPDQRRIVEKLRLARDDLHGDIKRLVQFQPSYRLRVVITVSFSTSNPIRLSFTESCIGAKLIADSEL